MKQRLSRQPKSLSEILALNGVLEISRMSIGGSNYGLGVTGGSNTNRSKSISTSLSFSNWCEQVAAETAL